MTEESGGWIVAGRTIPPAPAPGPGWIPVTGEPSDFVPGVRTILVTILLAIDLLVLGVSFIFQIVIGVAALSGRPPETTTADATTLLWWGTALNLVLFGLIPFLWVLGSRRVPWTGTLQHLGLHSWRKSLLVGVGLAGFAFAAVLLLGWLLELLPDGVAEPLVGTTESESSYFAIFAGLTWPLAIFIALAAGIGEEIFFRGVLQKWVGVWGQALIFVLAHMGNAFPFQWIVAFALALTFGYLRKAGWSLVALIVAHTVYDIVLLGIFLTFG